MTTGHNSSATVPTEDKSGQSFRLSPPGGCSGKALLSAQANSLSLNKWAIDFFVSRTAWVFMNDNGVPYLKKEKKNPGILGTFFFTVLDWLALSLNPFTDSTGCH